MAIPAPVEAALAAFRDLTAQALPAESRAQRLRTEVLLPLARAYGDALAGDDTGWQRLPADLPEHQRATFAAARACLVVLGNGRSALTADLLREVSRLGEGFCDLHLRVLDVRDPHGRDTLARLGRAQLHATLCMVGAEATGDLGAAHRARQRFADLGDEAAVQASEHLIRRLGGIVAPGDDPLRTVEMEVVPVDLIGGVTAPQTVVQVPTNPSPSLGTTTPGPTTEALATVGPVAPALRPVKTADPPGRRRPEPAASTVLTTVWPPPRNQRVHLWTTALVLTTVAATGLIAFGVARRAAANHRAARAHDLAAPSSAAPAGAVGSTGHTTSPPSPVAAAPTFAVTLAPPTAAAPLVAPPEPTGTTGPKPPAAADAAEAVTADAPPSDEPPRVRARRLNTEGFRAYERGDLTLALSQYRAATEADPSLGLPWYNLACVEALEGRVDAALEALETFHRIEPGVDLARRVEADRDFARVRGVPAFKAGLAALLGAARPQVPAQSH